MQQEQLLQVQAGTARRSERERMKEPPEGLTAPGGSLVSTQIVKAPICAERPKPTTENYRFHRRCGSDQTGADRLTLDQSGGYLYSLHKPPHAAQRRGALDPCGDQLRAFLLWVYPLTI